MEKIILSCIQIIKFEVHSSCFVCVHTSDVLVYITSASFLSYHLFSGVIFLLVFIAVFFLFVSVAGEDCQGARYRRTL